MLAPADAETLDPAAGDDPGSCSSRTTCSPRPPPSSTARRADTLEDKVDASVDDVASLITIKAKDGDAAGAAAHRQHRGRHVPRAARAPPTAGASRRRAATSARRSSACAARRGRRRRSPPSASGSASSASARSPAPTSCRSPRPRGPPERAESPRPLQNTVLALFAALLPRRARRARPRLHGAARQRPAAVRRPDRPRAARRAARPRAGAAAAPRRRRPTRRSPPRCGSSSRSRGASCSSPARRPTRSAPRSWPASAGR